jgi:hypothetical protein
MSHPPFTNASTDAENTLSFWRERRYVLLNLPAKPVMSKRPRSVSLPFDKPPDQLTLDEVLANLLYIGEDIRKRLTEVEGIDPATLSPRLHAEIAGHRYLLDRVEMFRADIEMRQATTVFH